MREFKFDKSKSTPMIQALLVGPKASKKVRLIFDTGAAMTQFDISTLNRVGYSKSTSIAKAKISGISGEVEDGLIFNAQKLLVLGSKISQVPVAGFDLSHLATTGIDGLLGFDLIKLFHLEMNGPDGTLKVF